MHNIAKDLYKLLSSGFSTEQAEKIMDKHHADRMEVKITWTRKTKSQKKKEKS